MSKYTEAIASIKNDLISEILAELKPNKPEMQISSDIIFTCIHTFRNFSDIFGLLDREELTTFLIKSITSEGARCKMLLKKKSFIFGCNWVEAEKFTLVRYSEIDAMTLYQLWVYVSCQPYYAKKHFVFSPKNPS